MKQLFRNIARRALSSDTLWKLFKPIIRTSDFLQYQRNFPAAEAAQQTRIRETQHLISLMGDPVVKHGPFQDMKYPSFTSYGSAMFPKIIGCYEREISHIIEQVCAGPYTRILDVGCAEGYYAVGFAIRNPSAQIFAYDTDEAAQQYCAELSKLNAVSDRVHVRATCTSKQLTQLPAGERTFILCDCEGYEKELFTAENIDSLRSCDLLVETHDFIDINISTYLEALFAQTHRVTVISSLGDIQKAKTYLYPETERLDLQTRYELVREGRPITMEWYFFESKQFL